MAEPGAKQELAAAELEIRARRLWNDTGVVLRRGSRFRVSARGLWIDRTEPPCGPEGYEKPSLGWARPFRRVRRAPWFALCGSIGRGPCGGFQIQPGDWMEAPRHGRLQLWANDAWLFYGNNKGALQARVEVEA